ncbi:FadR/GntR family transcriptional regulator [Acrocarpospora macrocephala]|uniref:GntR family transcriptional regulator n=1 Tax=Acrocarpospora macrocephala TaxID=150177 RepID=A0A5M3WY73_9ACTN|nr:FCD domain-containing protein [Acrocarpospora macrocephala]GES13884.1 GntR family transcriptional regulator [Acrocarpospora macrocephala]
MSTYRGRGIHGQVVEIIGRRLVTGQIAENGRIDLVELEAELQVSRTVVREALKVLAGKGLVDSRQKRGTVVRPRSEWNLLDPDVISWEFENRGTQMLRQLAEVRQMFEPAAAGLAAARRTEADLAELEAALAGMAAARTPAEAASADLRFHRAVLAATGNELLVRMEVVVESVLAERDRIVHDVVTADDPVPSHRALLDAIRAGDEEAARTSALALLDKAMADVDRAARLQGDL